ncbi:non-specific serine/threonine protein kinase [Trifolium repens]|nr:non-specific serine/threonine protein kinase [Trifolium repens]
MAQQRAQQSVSGTGGGSHGGIADGNARAQGPGGSTISSDIQTHQGSQSVGGIGSHDGGNSHGQEPERSTSAESNIHNANDQPLQQGSANLNEGGQNTLRRAGALGFVASAASAFDAAKDIMEALRGKHTNLASELEVLLTEIGSFWLCACFSADAVNKHVIDVEVPGQYFTDQEIAPDHTVKLDRVAADIPIVRRHGSSFRRLTLIGSDGSQRHFIVHTS